MNAPFKTLTHDLTQGQAPRVWSLLVSVFGDLAQQPDATISGTLLSRMTGAIGIKPEANRVALHRLRKEGWLVSHRSGRQSAYALTDWGRSQTALATPLIYSAPAPAEAVWLIAVDPSATSLNANCQSVGSGLFLSPEPVTRPDVLCLALSPDTSIPDWMRRQVCNDEKLALAQSTDIRFRAAEATLHTVGELTPLQSAVTRVLIVHAWRRLVLRTPRLPDFVFPRDWCGPSCRVLSARLLAQLERPALITLEDMVCETKTT